MLNIPDSIKALYLSDSVRKNFRVVFPNGEHSDLTNSDIVAGSVKFTESVCSKDVLQFGLAEASRIEFECVGVPNIYGVTIECYSEIDTSSLDAGTIATIQSDPGDGFIVLEADSDIGYGYYRVPYGVFRVQSCPRNAGAMTHRRVEGYTTDVSVSLQPSQFLSDTLTIGSDTNRAVINVPLLLASETNDITGLTLTESTKSFTSLAGALTPFPLVKWAYEGADCYVTISDLDLKRCNVGVSKDSLFKFTSSIDRTVLDQVYQLMKSNGASDDAVRKLKGMIEPGVWYGYPAGWITRLYAVPFRSGTDSGYTYVYNGNQLNNNICYPDSFTVTVNIGGTDTTLTDSGYVTDAVLKEYASAVGIYTRIKSTGKVSTGYTFVDALNLQDLFTGNAELTGKYLGVGRNGDLRSVALSKASPVSVTLTDYSNMWWDEYSISPIGSVKYTYFDADANQENTAIYTFGNGLSEYDMTSNYLLKNLSVKSADVGVTVEEYVISLLDTYFIPNLGDIEFIPVDLEAVGLPYIEAGDYIEVECEDGTTVGTYVLSRTLTGEQHLEDSIESKGGEIINSEVRSA